MPITSKDFIDPETIPSLKKSEKVYISCVGIDMKKHICEPHKDKCKCGMPVHKKKMTMVDIHRFSCYECTF